MSCFYPLAGFIRWDKLSVNGKRLIKINGRYDPEYVQQFPFEKIYKIPCGHCLGCRLDYSRNWADRICLELDSFNGLGIFVTLTYNDDWVPNYLDPLDEYGDCTVGYTLRKKDLQDFFKRLRKAFPDRIIRYYASGEYGGKTHRPHYHAVILGIDLHDFTDRIWVGKNEIGQDYYTSPSFARLWSKKGSWDPERQRYIYSSFGFVCLSEISYKTAAYVTRYTAKKAFGTSWQPHGDAEEEFSLMSRNPGLGKTYLCEHPTCLELSKVSISDQSGSISILIPKYFFAKFKEENPDKWKKMVEDRMALSVDKELMKLFRTDLSYTQQLDMDYSQLVNKTQILFKRREEIFDEANCIAPD